MSLEKKQSNISCVFTYILDGCQVWRSFPNKSLYDFVQPLGRLHATLWFLDMSVGRLGRRFAKLFLDLETGDRAHA